MVADIRFGLCAAQHFIYIAHYFSEIPNKYYYTVDSVTSINFVLNSLFLLALQ